MSLAALAQSVKSRATSAEAVTRDTLERMRRGNADYLCFTRILADEAITAARAIDARIAAGDNPGPLAGVPFAVKDLFDIKGMATTAGALMRVNAPPAARDAEAVRRLKAAGAVLVGTTNMDEFAYGFATVNAHFGTTRNPHDVERLAGGSSGGSAAAVAAGLVPLSLGSDTNGSIRVPASLCGVWGMRPAEGAVPLDGVFPFVEALDTAGPFTRSAADLKLAYEVLSGVTVSGGGRLRVARLGGFFARNVSAEAVTAIDAVMAHIGSDAVAELPGAEAARSAAFLITAAQGGALHLDTLRQRTMDYDPQVRDRLLAGAMLPAAAYVKAWRVRQQFRTEVARLFEDYDVLLAPSTPVVAPRISESTVLIDGKPASARANLGIHCQPLSLAGMAVISAPFSKGLLPIGVQFSIAPGCEGAAFDLLQALENDGLLGVAEMREAA